MTADHPDVFVSHSTCGRPECGCLAVRESAVELLVDAGFNPVLDKRDLIAGDHWHDRLLELLNDSRGCVALISPHALESHFVYEELIIARVLHEENGVWFRLIPVLTCGATPEQIPGGKLGPLGLEALHLARWEAPDGVPLPAPRDLTDALGELLTVPPGFPEPDVYETVSGHLQPLSRQLLKRAADALEVSGRRWTPALHRIVAAALLQERLVETEPDPFRTTVKDLLPKVATEGRAEVIDRVVPYARVPAEAAQQMRQVAARPSRRIAALRATNDRTPGFYLRRASEGDNPWEHVEPAGGDAAGYAASLVADIRTVIEEKVAWGVPVSDAAELDRLIRRHEDEEGPLVVVLRQPPDPALVDLLNAEFPRVTFVYVTGDGAAVPDAVPIRALSEAQEDAMVRLDTELRARFLARQDGPHAPGVSAPVRH